MVEVGAHGAAEEDTDGAVGDEEVADRVVDRERGTGKGDRSEE